MGDSTEKKTLAVVVASLAVTEQVGLVWVFRAADMAERPGAFADDMVSRIGPVGLALFATILFNVILACAFYLYSKRMPADASERVACARAGLAL